MEIIELEQVTSTNSYAKEGIEDFKDRTVIIANSQTSGRGRLSRSWVDLGRGNLFMTIVLKPSDTFKDLYSNITQYMSISLCHVLEKYNLTPQIKWPNDVLINGKKIAGILSETVMQGSNFKGLVLGIGVNLNAKDENLKLITDKVVTSVNIEINEDVNLKEFVNKLLDEFFKNYDEFLEKGFLYLKDEYLNKNCSLNKELKVQVFNKIETGFAKDIDDNGGLILVKNNKNTVLTIGDIL